MPMFVGFFLLEAISKSIFFLQKQSLLEKEFVFSKETQVEFAKLMDAKKINILGLDNLSGAELIHLGELLKLKDVKKKSSLNIRNEIKHLTKLFLAGQVTILKETFY